MDTFTDTLRILAEHNTQTSAATDLENALYAYNKVAAGHSVWQPVVFCLRDESGALQGGITGYLWGGWMHITVLWVHESLRRRGFGDKLLSAAEGYAQAQGCANAYLSTFEFQAPAFYRSHGYEQFGELAGCPEGHAYYFMRKRLK